MWFCSLRRLGIPVGHRLYEQALSAACVSLEFVAFPECFVVVS